MIRLFDFLLSLTGLIILLPIFVLLLIFGLYENGSPMFLQKKIGYNQTLFVLIKFRTMKKNTELLQLIL